MTFVLGACHNSILGVYGIFLTKNMFQSSKFSEGIFLHGLFLVILYQIWIGWPDNRSKFRSGSI